jgi:hypothetical protein
VVHMPSLGWGHGTWIGKAWQKVEIPGIENSKLGGNGTGTPVAVGWIRLDPWSGHNERSFSNKLWLQLMELPRVFEAPGALPPRNATASETRTETAGMVHTISGAKWIDWSGEFPIILPKSSCLIRGVLEIWTFRWYVFREFEVAHAVSEVQQLGVVWGGVASPNRVR